MAYFLNLFSPETYEAFSASDQRISGFRVGQRKAAQKIKPGDRLICYMTRLSRWIGILEVEEGPFEDASPIYFEEDDPFIIRFKVQPLAWLPRDKTLPIHENDVWGSLSFTRDRDPRTSAWTGKLRASLTQLEDEDGMFLEERLLAQQEGGNLYPVDDAEYRRLVTHRVRRSDRVVSVSIPESDDSISAEVPSTTDIRESHKMQALLADIGSKMGMKIWVPRNDRVRVEEQMKQDRDSLLTLLPLNYDDTTLKTIEQIDVLWLRGRAIMRAFEVEHTTAVYSGILRMADLLALQPNMDIKLHIVASVERRDKVFTEIRRPVFAFLGSRSLAERCTFLSYDSLKELAALRHLTHFSDSVLDEYAEEVE